MSGALPAGLPVPLSQQGADVTREAAWGSLAVLWSPASDLKAWSASGHSRSAASRGKVP